MSSYAVSAGPSPELFFETAFAHQRTAALKAAIDLDVFTALNDGARTARAVADDRGMPERGIRILCDYLTVLGFLTKRGDTYELTPDSAAFLSKRSPAYLGGTLGFLNLPTMLEKFGRLTETIRRGFVPQEESSVAEANPIWVDFARSMMPMMVPAAHGIADVLQAEAAGALRVLDIAAGHGIFGITIAQRNPAAVVTAVDWPAVLSVAQAHARAMGVADRYQTIPGDAFTVEFGTGYDVVLLTNFIHHFDRETTVSFLAKTGAALKATGKVVLLEFVPNEDRVSPPLSAGFALTMLATTPQGDAYTMSELKEMFTAAGLTGMTAHPFPGPQTIVVATK